MLAFATSVRSNAKPTNSNQKRRRFDEILDDNATTAAATTEQHKQPKTNQFKRNVNSRHTTTNNNDNNDDNDDDDVDESANSLRARHHIKIYHDVNPDDDGDNDDDNSNNATTQSVPSPIDSFDVMARRFDWPQWLVKNLAAFQFSAPTAIQMQAIPIMMADQDLFAYSATGSGKTLAFMLPILARLREPRHAGARAIVLCPTRELAQQIFAVILRLTKGTSWNTLFVRKETTSNRNFLKTADRFDLLVATPFRLAELVAKGYPLANVEHVVLDEADRLFDMSDQSDFIKQIDSILAACTHAARRCWLFSATRVETAEELARSVLHEPVRVVVGAQNRALETVSQRLIYTGDERGKLLGLWQLIRGGVSTPMLVFVQSQSRAIELARELRIGNVRAAAVHGGCSQQERDDIVSQFRIGEIFVIVATDVLARGIDYSAVKCVVNYDVPLTRTNYIHRVGRTGRAGRRGEAVTFCSKEDRDALRIIASIMKESGSEVPDWIFKLPNPTAQARKELARRPVRRDKISKGRTMQNFGADDDDNNDNADGNNAQAADDDDSSDDLDVYRGVSANEASDDDNDDNDND